VQLIDTYDPLRGARHACETGRPLWKVRIDSGDFVKLSKQMRRILNQAKLTDAKIMLSGDLDEHRIRDLLAAGAPVDAFGVGTQLATSADAPHMSAIYKLVEVDISGIKRFTAKFSDEKMSLPGSKQVFRLPDRDILARSGENATRGGAAAADSAGRQLDRASPHFGGCAAARRRRSRRSPRPCDNWRAEPWPVDYSNELLALIDRTPQPADMKTLFFDIDTQIDFLYPAGRCTCGRGPDRAGGGRAQPPRRPQRNRGGLQHGRTAGD
jgi:nicotinate phosphoribosyltransferase